MNGSWKMKQTTRRHNFEEFEEVEEEIVVLITILTVHCLHKGRHVGLGCGSYVGFFAPHDPERYVCYVCCL